MTRAALPWALLLGLLAGAGAASARPAFRAACEDAAQASRARFASRDSGYRIDNGLSYRALTAMKRPGVAPGMVLGLTRTESRVSIHIDGQVRPDARQQFECIAPQVAVTLYYPPITVYVGREFKPGTCAYREILAHEMRHLKAYLEWLPKVEEHIRTRLAARYIGKPLYAQRGQARALLQADIDRNWMPTIRNEMLRIEALQAAIDSPQEYARLSKVCGAEVQSLIGSTSPTRTR